MALINSILKPSHAIETDIIPFTDEETEGQRRPGHTVRHGD